MHTQEDDSKGDIQPKNTFKQSQQRSKEQRFDQYCNSISNILVKCNNLQRISD